jgi:hypothetical protein
MRIRHHNQVQTNQGSKKINEMDVTKIYNIAEILGILDETNRGKDWLLEEIKKHHVKIPPKLPLQELAMPRIGARRLQENTRQQT